MAQAVPVLLLAALLVGGVSASLFEGGKPTTTAEHLLDAIMTRSLEWWSFSHVVPVNCSMIPNGTVHDPTATFTSMFHVVLGEPEMSSRPRRVDSSMFVAAEGEDLGFFERYLPLLNKNSETLDRLTGGFPTVFAVSLADRARRTDPLFATIDFSTGRFIINREVLTYLPETPSDYIVESYMLLERKLEGLDAHTFVDRLPTVMVDFLRSSFESANPAACFLCIVIFAPIITIVANIVAAWYGQQICLECDLSASACNAVIIYMLSLVYQNLPLLAAILFRICGDLCVLGLDRIVQAGAN